MSTAVDHVERRPRRERRPWIALLLLVASMATMFWAGLWQSWGFHHTDAHDSDALLQAEFVPAALAYVGALACVLIAHEAGHYIAARRRNVGVSLPWFIPGIPPLGTFGAIIRLDLEPMPARRLAPVAAWGPIAGFVALIPVLVVGLMLSEVRPLAADADVLHLGEPLLLQWLIGWTHGTVPPGEDVFLHPVAFAGWTGLLVTALNMLPFGQLDGGHVWRCLIGPLHNRMVALFLVAFLVLGVLVYRGWLVVALLLIVVVGVRHPPMISSEGLDAKSRILCLLAILTFILSFTPAPVH